MALFDALFECSFRDVPFPALSVDMQGSHDLAEHKRMDRDGARQEATGLNPYRFSVKAVFVNTIARGRNETWSNLFPDQYNKLLAALADRSTAEFVHPIHGPILCKANTWNVALTGEAQGGVFLDIEFVQTLPDDDVSVDITATSAPAEADRAFADLQALVGKIVKQPGLEEVPDVFEAVSNVVKEVDKVGDQIDLVGKQFSAKVDRTVGAIDRMSDIVDNTAADVEDFADKLHRLKAALLAQKDAALVSSGVTKFHKTNVATTLAALSTLLDNDVADLAKLNPHLVGKAQVEPGSLVRFYA